MRMVAAERDGNRAPWTFILELARVIETQLLLHVIDRDDKSTDEVVPENAVHAMSFTRRQPREVERRRNALNERRAGEPNAGAVELRAGDRARARAAPDEGRAELDAESLGGMEIQKRRAGAGVENEIQRPVTRAHLHVDVIAVDVDRDRRRLRGGGRRRQRTRGIGGLCTERRSNEG